jgi:hypothetical protein
MWKSTRSMCRAAAIYAIALRAYDPERRQRAIWWFDGRVPHGELDPPVVGRFQAGVGAFFGHTTLNDRPMRIRFIWSQITSTSARWRQAYSFDGGKSWEMVWAMEFQRADRHAFWRTKRPEITVGRLEWYGRIKSHAA